MMVDRDFIESVSGSESITPNVTFERIHFAFRLGMPFLGVFSYLRSVFDCDPDPDTDFSGTHTF